MRRRPPRSTRVRSSAASDVYKRQHDIQAGNGTKGGQVLDGLMGRSVLSETDGVVGPDEGHGQLLEGGQSNRRTHVVREHQEGAAVGTSESLQRDSVEDAAHAELADAEVQGPAEGAALVLVCLLARGDEAWRAGHRRVVGPCLLYTSDA